MQKKRRYVTHKVNLRDCVWRVYVACCHVCALYCFVLAHIRNSKKKRKTNTLSIENKKKKTVWVRTFETQMKKKISLLQCKTQTKTKQTNKQTNTKHKTQKKNA